MTDAEKQAEKMLAYVRTTKQAKKVLAYIGNGLSPRDAFIKAIVDFPHGISLQEIRAVHEEVQRLLEEAEKKKKDKGVS